MCSQLFSSRFDIDRLDPEQNTAVQQVINLAQLGLDSG